MRCAAVLLRLAAHSLGPLLQLVQLVPALHSQLVGATNLGRRSARSAAQLL